uniref:Tubulin--tyrosine ligase-like protein 9 n=1 Tax=Amorphochlora amoebiformis TaxID=1561963 RepID=A0A7S0H469_9EUKA
MDPNNFWKQIEEMVSVTLISLRPQLKQRYESLLLSRLEAAKTRKNKSNSRPPDQKSADSTDHRVASGLDEKIGEWDRCFQILGFDVILDEKGKAYLLEINDHPSLRSPTPLDKVIKAGVMRETLKIMDPDTRGIKHRKINACEDMTFKPPPQDAKNTKASQQEVKKGESTGGETLNGSNNAAVKVGRMNMKYLTILPETTYKGLVER